jgi:hypothetical protein
LINRRLLLSAAAGAVVCGGIGRAAGTELLTAENITAFARRLVDANRRRIAQTDLIGIANFSAPSWSPRFYFVNLLSGGVESFLVSHGRGSDPGHTGWLQKFSNDIGSNASSFGAYVTGEQYVGKHGRSMRLVGLDAENSNAEARAIVVHGAWYVSDKMIAEHGKIGRSEGCFAFSEADLVKVLDRMGPGRLLFAGKA